MKERLGIALVGLGNYSTNHLAPALENTTKAYLAGVVTGSDQKADDYVKRYSIKETNIFHYDNFDAIAGNTDIDIIYVVLPTSSHADFAIRAAKAGKHVIVEKPMSTSVAECEQIINACNEAQVKLGVGYRLHYEPHNKKAMEIGQNEIFGKVNHLKASNGFRMTDTNQWRAKKNLAGGGALMDLGIYGIQAGRYVTGQEPISVTACYDKTEPDRFPEVEENIHFELEYPNKAIANFWASYTTDVSELVIEEERGWHKIHNAFEYNNIKSETREEQLEFENVYQQVLQIDDFADCIINNKEVKVSGEMGLQDIRIIEAVYASAEANQKLKISDKSPVRSNM